MERVRDVPETLREFKAPGLQSNAVQSPLVVFGLRSKTLIALREERTGREGGSPESCLGEARSESCRCR